ncbi:MAG TPA: TatD family hydrolase, partial [Candidatus Binataceae bacterium]|nr:TatD family hydrolase [Candidatus Binataceae bacterium]
IDARRESICAIGEVGLPYYGDASRHPGFVAATRARLARFASEAARFDLALCLHCPHEAASEALRIITRAGVRRAVFHWHKSDQATTRAIIAAGYFISITPEVVYRERDRELARTVPLANLLVETDGPWPHDGPFAGKLTEPAMIALSIEAIAEIKTESIASVADATTSNARRLFNI